MDSRPPSHLGDPDHARHLRRFLLREAEVRLAGAHLAVAGGTRVAGAGTAVAEEGKRKGREEQKEEEEEEEGRRGASHVKHIPGGAEPGTGIMGQTLENGDEKNRGRGLNGFRSAFMHSVEFWG